jgi:mannose PTS system EIIA component
MNRPGNDPAVWPQAADNPTEFASTMTTILIVAHAPLASTLELIAQHVYSECAGEVLAIDIPAGATLESATQEVSRALQGMASQDVLILTDVFGATPCNAALAASEGRRARVLAGVNVPMLWRSLCYAKLPLFELVVRASEGGVQGIMPVAAPHRQNQSPRQNPPLPDASDPNSDQ